MTIDTDYVTAEIDPTGNYADCSYFTDPACTQPASEPLRISQSAGACKIVQGAASALVLVGTVFKTLGQAPALNDSNFAPANDENTVAISMPTATVVTKGAVLLFSNPGMVQSLYPSTDPEIKNDQN
jgi:hypothetical protein